MKILLTGNPNVGKSVIFSHLSNIKAISSNYPGTTVEVLCGETKLSGVNFDIIDLPGIYSLNYSNKAEEVAAKILESNDYDLIINVIDANSLERNLFLAFQILKLKKPTIFLINKCDIAKNKGIIIDFKGLSEKLGVKIIPVVATTGEGFKNLEKEVQEFLKDRNKFIPEFKVPEDDLEKWKLIGEITTSYQKIIHKHPTFLEKLELLTATPSVAIPIALVVMLISFYVIRFIGEGLINYIMDPLFNNYYQPFINNLVSKINTEWIKFILVGKNGVAMESFGILTTAVYIPFVAVFPYMISFYAVLGFLEDVGYLPRLAVILDKLSHKIGLHGYGTIPLIMGLGCKVPGIFSLRILESNKEKVIASSLLFLMTPCMPQTAMIFSLLGKYPIVYTFLFFGFIFLVGFLSGVLLSKVVKGQDSELFIEIPSYQLPKFSIFIFKLKLRLKEFLKDAVPLIIAGIFLINILDMFNFLDKISSFFAPFFSKLLGLPGEMASVVALGFLKKDVAITFLFPFNLTLRQIMVSSAFLVMYLPCIASIFVLWREIGKKNTIFVILFNLLMAILFSAIFNIFLSFVM